LFIKTTEDVLCELLLDGNDRKPLPDGRETLSSYTAVVGVHGLKLFAGRRRHTNNRNFSACVCD
jgi:hypothetical protein